MTDYLLGIELAGAQLKIASFIKDGNIFKVHSFDKLVVDIESEKNQAKLLEWKNSNFPRNAKISAVLSVPESALYLKEFILPKLPKKQINEAIRWEVVSSAPFPKEDIICEWKKLQEKDKSKLKVLAICARESSIRQMVSTFENIGIKIFAVEPATLSFERVAQANFDPATLLMTVEHEETNLLVLKNATPVFTTSISTPIYAEKSGKRRLSKSIISDLAQQAYKTIEFWQEKSAEKISQVIITGDIAQRYWGLAEAINKIAGVPSLMASKKKLDNVTFPKIANAVQLRYIIPIGAFYRFVEGEEEVNLLPVDKKELINKLVFSEKINQASVLLSAVNFSLIVVSLIALIGLSFWNRSLIKLKDQKEYQVKNHPANVYKAEVNEINNLVVTIDNLLIKQKDMGTRLSAISEMTPKKVTLTSIDFGQSESEEWKIGGVGDRVDILSFYDKITANSAIKDTSMPYSNLSKESGNEFEIKILW